VCVCVCVFVYVCVSRAYMLCAGVWFWTCVLAGARSELLHVRTPVGVVPDRCESAEA